MANPQDKANEIIDKHYWLFGDGYLGTQHIQHALLEVDEILELIKNTDWLNDGKLQLWQEVKTIITNY